MKIEFKAMARTASWGALSALPGVGGGGGTAELVVEFHTCFTRTRGRVGSEGDRGEAYGCRNWACDRGQCLWGGDRDWCPEGV